MLVTIFPSVRAPRGQEHDLTPAELVSLIRTTQAPTKHELPLLKLGRFGDLPSSKGSYRHDPNLREMSGLEVDYDAERMPFELAVETLKAAQIEAILYTSPSHTPDAPRWRVLFPFSTLQLPATRPYHANRANGLLGGALARESWVLSQIFYFGAAQDAATFQVIHLSGTPLDLYDPEALALPPAPASVTHPHTRPKVILPQAADPADTSDPAVPPSDPIDELPRRVRSAIRSGDPTKFGYGTDRSRLVFYVACSLVRAGWAEPQIAELLADPAYPISQHVRDQNNPASYARRQASSAARHVQEDWERTPNGATLVNDSQTNIARGLREMGINLSYNVFQDLAYVNGAGPSRPLNDREALDLRFALERRYKLRPSRQYFFDLLDTLAAQNSFHPVAEFLDSLVWDGVHRLGDAPDPDNPDAPADPAQTPSWLTTYGGAEDTRYTRYVGRITLIAAVRRVRHPGYKHDEMLVLVDPTQGTGKSTTLATLAVRPEWFSDSLPLGADDRRAIEHLAGKWIIEFAELAGMRHAEVETMKSFLSRTHDRARMAYARYVKELPRSCIFIGTANTEMFLRDVENRRFWPVLTRPFDLAALARDVEQLWAEAAYAERARETSRLPQPYWPVAAAVQSAHRLDDTWADEIARTLDGFEGKVAALDLWTLLGLRAATSRGQPDNARLGDVMRSLGWQRTLARVYGKVSSVYVSPNAPLSPRQIVVTRDPLTGQAQAEYLEPRPAGRPRQDSAVGNPPF